jgi:hypothetical protein
LTHRITTTAIDIVEEQHKKIRSLEHKLRSARRAQTTRDFSHGGDRRTCMYCWGSWEHGEKSAHSQTCVFYGLDEEA